MMISLINLRKKAGIVLESAMNSILSLYLLSVGAPTNHKCNILLTSPTLLQIKLIAVAFMIIDETR